MYSPAKIRLEDGTEVKGVVLEGKELYGVIELIDRTNAEGLKREDAALLLRLKAAYRVLADDGKII